MKNHLYLHTNRFTFLLCRDVCRFASEYGFYVKRTKKTLSINVLFGHSEFTAMVYSNQ